MSLSTMLSIFLTIHLIALTVMAGTTLIDFLSYRTFWKHFSRKSEQSVGILEVLDKFSRVAGIGAALLIISGVGMMAVTRGVFGEHLWFRIKFALVIVLIANGLLGGRRQSGRLRKVIAVNGPDLRAQTAIIRSRLNRFHVLQLCILVTIIFLSVFKFN